MKTNIKQYIYILLCGLLATLMVSCSTQKDTAINRKLQNLSARYNIIYNSNLLMEDYLLQQNEAQQRDYSSLLPLYLAPAIADVKSVDKKVKEFDEIDSKARKIIAEKNYSNYVDEAYMLLGKTNFYQGKYYNATEYFDYVARGFKKNRKVYLNALTWKARSYMELNEYKVVNSVVDSIKIVIDSVRKDKSATYATLAQLSINNGDYKSAISNILTALKAGPSNVDKINWTYTLAQLYEEQQDYTNSLIYYRKIIKSNAPYEMYFNASLSNVRINEKLYPQDFDKNKALSKLLKDDKNADFQDQIYYEIAQDYNAINDVKNSEKYYLISAHSSKKNNTQKALSYLKIAEISLQYYNDYATAKKYYDSTLLFLPKNNIAYKKINNKANSLSYIQKRQEIINFQDSLQKFANLNEADRELAIKNYAEREALAKESTTSTDINEADRGDTNSPKAMSWGRNTFYFANSDAISRGLAEFKKKWGNRKLAPFWRNSTKKSSDLASNTSSPLDIGMPNTGGADPDVVSSDSNMQAALYKQILDSLPITPKQLEQSNQKIISAYLEIGSYLQQDLKDNTEAINTFQTLLKRFPNFKQLDRVYYSLYLAYLPSDKVKSDDYKNLVLTKYANTDFAKIIIDPNFSLKQNELELKLKQAYEEIFSLLQNKQYKEVISNANNINQRFPQNILAAQIEYLKALAIGHTADVNQLLAAFKTIILNFKSDKLIKPLVEQNIAYINSHLSEFKVGKTALLESKSDELAFSKSMKNASRREEPIIANILDPNGNKKVAQLIVAQTNNSTPVQSNNKQIDNKIKQIEDDNASDSVKEVKEQLVISKVDENKNLLAKKDTLAQQIDVKTNNTTDTLVKNNIIAVKNADTLNQSKIVQNLPVAAKVEKTVYKDDLFSLDISDVYYFVVAVNTYENSVSSSRFGIGQFNRGNYSGANLRHFLEELDKDQLIGVGDFKSLSEVKEYQERIAKQITNIMKFPTANYTTFVISKDNWTKITNRNTLERYIKFAKQNEL